MIYFDNVSKTYNGGNGVALEGVSFQVAPKEFVSIVGHSGAGKTTLLKMLIAEDRPTDGQVFFESLDIHQIPRSRLPKYRRKLVLFFRILSYFLIKQHMKTLLLLWKQMDVPMMRL